MLPPGQGEALYQPKKKTAICYFFVLLYFVLYSRLPLSLAFGAILHLPLGATKISTDVSTG